MAGEKYVYGLLVADEKEIRGRIMVFLRADFTDANRIRGSHCGKRMCNEPVES